MLMTFITLIVALTLVQLMTSFRLDNRDHENEDSIINWFGSVQRAMVMLFQSTTGGIDWGDLYDTVALAGELPALFFLCFIVFFNFAILNIVTSIFVEKAVKLQRGEEETNSRMMD